ncbi:DNA polymerase III subunit alpha [Salinibacter ruber]|uniref:DNA polymerase III subunit alpha n=1 Tax=Salinibacter ruber TaxID=146919 RepID=UPI002168F6D2
MSQHSEGIIATSSCVQGILPKLALGEDQFSHLSKRERIEKAHEVTETYLDIFGDDFYLEAHRHGMEDEETMNDLVQYLSGKYDIPVITANDCHYTRPEDYEIQKVRTCLSRSEGGGDNVLLTDEDGGRFAHENMHVKSAEEMISLFEEFPDAAENTMRIAESCGARLPMEEGEYFFPEFPDLGPAETPKERLTEECAKGFRRRYPGATQAHKDRMRYELGVIDEMGFNDYFLIVSDVVQWAKAQGIRVGPGRGSAAGSMVTYCLGITDLDPMAHGLLFDRFLNHARTTMPDIDIDFDDTRREEVIRHIRTKYGEDRVSEAITFNRFQLRQAIRDTSRVFGLKPTEQDDVADEIKAIRKEHDVDTVEGLLEVSPKLRRKRQDDERFNKTCEKAKDMIGLARHPGRHPAAVIVTPDETSEHVPTQALTSSGEKHIVTQFDGDQLEDLGLLKIDVLGLSALSEIDRALEMARDLGYDISEEDLESRDDPKVYEEIFATGDTKGVFQFESDGMRQFLEQMEPTEFVHIAAMNALYRPGPMQQIPEFIARMHGEEETIYIDPSIHDAIKDDVAGILDDTYGIMVFQEQVMQVCQEVAGFSLGQADIMRRAIGKKKEKLLMEQKQKFVEGCIEQGYDRSLGETIFQKIEEFADYAFNRAHSSSYAALAYKQAYLKCYCREAFQAAIVQSKSDDGDRADQIRELRREGVDVKRPSINKSKAEFAATGEGEVRFGLSTIKYVGKEAQVFLEERETGGPFESFMECLCRCTPNARAVKALIKAGAFDDFDLSRAAMMEAHDKVLTYARKRRSYKQGSRKSMPDAPKVHDVAEFPRQSRFQQEREVASTYTGGPPTDDFQWLARHLSGHEHTYKGTRYRLELATVMEVREATTSTGKRMWWVTYQTAGYEIPDSAAMWDSTYEEIGDHLRPDTAVMLVLETDVRGEYAGSYTVENAVPARQIPARFGQVACVETQSPEAARSALERLSELPEGEMEA